MAELWDIEDKTDLSITFNNKVISSEGPHGGSGELSMGKVLGIINEKESKQKGYCISHFLICVYFLIGVCFRAVKTAYR